MRIRKTVAKKQSSILRVAAIEHLENRRMLSATLVKDINTQPDPNGLALSITPANTVTYFTGNDSVHGYELWKTDGTSAGTSMVQDIYPGYQSSNPSQIVMLGSVAYFAATDSNGNELWRSDGTSAGTYLVKNIYSGSSSSSPLSLCVFNNKIYFMADDNSHGREIWLSDGTTAGTMLMRDLYSLGGQTPGTGMIASTGSQLFYYCYNGTDYALYTTTTGTVGSGIAVFHTPNYLVSDLTVAGSRVYWRDSQSKVYSSDGTSAGTLAVDSSSFSISKFVVAGSYVFYVGSNLLKCTSGSASTTVSGSFTNPVLLGAVGNTPYFSARSSSTNLPQLYYATAGGTGAVLVSDNITATAGNAVGSLFYFSAGTSATGYSLYKTDGTSAGTALIKSINPGGSLPSPSSFTTFGSLLLFNNSDAINETQLWASDGTASGTNVLKVIFPADGSSNPSLGTIVNGKIIFTASDGLSGNEPWVSDGTAAGTLQLKDIYPGTSSSQPVAFRTVGNLAYFDATDPTHGEELWRTDGTPAGTFLLADIYPGNDANIPHPVGSLNGWYYFAKADLTHRAGLWKTDGTSANTQFVVDFSLGGITPVGGVAFNNALYFTAAEGTHGAELWKTDGTSAGTTLVSDIFPGAAGSNVSIQAVLGNELILTAQGSDNSGTELWSSDGTASGTALLKEINTASRTGSNPGNFVTLGDKVYFTATDSIGKAIWKTDGTTAGTVMVDRITANNLTGMNGKLYFTATDGTHTGQLWSSDGTLAGTGLVNTNLPKSIIGALNNVGGRLFYVADDNAGAGYELWSSDGTSSGTAMVQDLYPGVSEGVTTIMFGLNGVVYVNGNNGSTGSELFKFPDIYSPTIYSAKTSEDAGDLSVSTTFSFSENVAATVSASDLVLQQFNSGVWQNIDITSAAYTYDGINDTATFKLPVGLMSDGRYRAMLTAGSVADLAGNALATASSTEFIYLSPSVNNDVINIQLASNGTDVQVIRNGSITLTTPLLALNGMIIMGGGGDDALTISQSAGNVLPTGAVIFDGGTGTNSFAFNASSGNHTVIANAGSLLSDSTLFNLPNVQNVSLDTGPGLNTLTVASGTLSLIPPAVSAGITSRTFSALNIAAGATLNVPANINPDTSIDHADRLVLVAQAGNILGHLDLGDNDVIFKSGNLATVRSLILSGQNGAAGIYSTSIATDPYRMTLAAILNYNALAPVTGNFDGQAVSASDVLLKQTYFGDADLNGSVNGNDYTLIDSGFTSAGTKTGWINGDFNYDGIIDGSDYSLIDNAFNRQTATIAAGPASAVANLAIAHKTIMAQPMSETVSASSIFTNSAISAWRKYVAALDSE